MSLLLPSKPAQKVFQGKIFSVWQWEQELFDGSTALFERIGRPDYACAIGVLPDNTILLVEDSQPNRETVITPAGGQVEAGETAPEALKREYMEETGYAIGELRPWMSFQPHSKVDMRTHIFIARNLEKKTEPALEAGERIVPVIYSFEEFLSLGQNQQLRELRLRIELLEAQIDPAKRQILHDLLFA